MSKQQNEWRNPTQARLEADIAYFEARLALLRRQPASCYHEAQVRAYKELEALLSDRLSRLGKREQEALEGYPGQIEVEEIPAESMLEEAGGSEIEWMESESD
ncbi:MAG: hypothetical protein KDI83_09525 [Gammaproteobacteria bacterium]|nr:hypothetical protein [Gammaproteobacteria bacterium]